jgi:hypothetical protein
MKFKKRGDEIKKISSPLKPLNQITLNQAGMVLEWVPFKIVSDSPALHSRWLLLLKIEISSIVQYVKLLLSMHLQLKFELILTYTKAAINN